MKKWYKCVMVFLLATALLIPMCAAAQGNEDTGDITILFTHDLHSHLLSSPDGKGGQYGGFARLMTVIREQKQKDPDAILVDGGDFSMGSLFQTAYATSAIEIRMLGALGYDATTFGNHEYDYLQSGLAAMLNTAVASGDKLPAILEANYLPPEEGSAEYTDDSAAVWAAFENYGVKEYSILERGGYYYVLFGLTGQDSDDCAPNSGQILHDPTQTAQRVVDAATAECKEKYGVDPIVVCLSHSGTEGGKGEDYELAKNVTGIDVIVSGHTHTTLTEPIQVGDTYIVSAGEYGKYLGVIRLNVAQDGSTSLAGYELIPINENVEEDTAIAAKVEQFKTAVEKDYLSKYGCTFDMALLNNPYTFDSVDDVYAYQHESTLGNLYSDAYHFAVEELADIEVDVALTASGVIRETIYPGIVTVSDVFNAASLGVGTEGELIAVYITGADLKSALEVDASVQPLMHSAQLFFSGVEYSFNTNRVIFDKVDYAMLRKADGTLEQIIDDKLYCVVTGMYAGQMLGSVEKQSFGLLAITPRDADGNPIATEDLADYVVYDKNGRPMKEWFAITVYLASMYGTMDEQYAAPDGRKVVYASWNPADLLREAGTITYIVLAIIVLLIVATALIIHRMVIRKRRKQKKGAA